MVVDEVVVVARVDAVVEELIVELLFVVLCAALVLELVLTLLVVDDLTVLLELAPLTAPAFLAKL